MKALRSEIRLDDSHGPLPQAPVITQAFGRTLLACHKAIRQKKIVGVVSPHGVGFKFAVRAFAAKHYLKVIACDLSYTKSLNKVFVSLLKTVSNVQFQQINNDHVSLFDLMRTVTTRLEQYEYCLVVIDNCSDMTPSQLKYLNRFLKRYDRKMGLIIRMTNRYLNKVQRTLPDEYVNLYNVVDDWAVLESPTQGDIVDICKFYHINDRMIIEDLIKACGGNLTTLTKQITRYHNLKWTEGDKGFRYKFGTLYTERT